ncbi:TetR/AcrR family transcriptional regulator [Sphaerisporangium corydalis]|uniref:TetR/AcrR family transcriptional regulator n=1 Tax=Sphaerisporangium corydalis TaxID=1441875 RepID=A0ABV9E6D7_9ACTN|nr:TetR/AcrR family transcriptional regulator [Sphaerisporangium corydalis]
MTSAAVPESGTRGRTRRAIVEAAVSVLGRDRTATLADIAGAAGVGRSTLHRYFADREELVEAVIGDSFRVVERSVQDAEPGQGPPLAAMRRLVAALVGAGDRLLFLFGDPRTLEGRKAAPEPAASPVIELIRRGQAEGVFDPEAVPAWIEQVLWALVYTGCEAAGKGLLSRHEVASAVVRTLENGIHVR